MEDRQTNRWQVDGRHVDGQIKDMWTDRVKTSGQTDGRYMERQTDEQTNGSQMDRQITIHMEDKLTYMWIDRMEDI